MTISKPIFTITGTVLAISMIFNYFLYNEVVNITELFTKAKESERLAISKNENLAGTIKSLENDRIVFQKLTDELNSENVALMAKSRKTRIVIKESIKYEPCYSASIHYPNGFGMHYN